jgi:hypothetical protein
MSEGGERTLTAVERVGLRVHLLMCAGCRNFARQLHFLRAAMQVYVPGAHGDSNAANPGAAPAPPDPDRQAGG